MSEKIEILKRQNPNQLIPRDPLVLTTNLNTFFSDLKLTSKQQEASTMFIKSFNSTATRIVDPTTTTEIDPANKTAMFAFFKKQYNIDFSDFTECSEQNCPLKRVPGYISVEEVWINSALGNISIYPTVLTIISAGADKNSFYSDLITLYTLLSDPLNKNATLKFYSIGKGTYNEAFTQAVNKLDQFVKIFSPKNSCSYIANVFDFIEQNKELSPDLIYSLHADQKSKLDALLLQGFFKDSNNLALLTLDSAGTSINAIELEAQSDQSMDDIDTFIASLRNNFNDTPFAEKQIDILLKAQGLSKQSNILPADYWAQVESFIKLESTAIHFQDFATALSQII